MDKLAIYAPDLLTITPEPAREFDPHLVKEGLLAAHLLCREKSLYYADCVAQCHIYAMMYRQEDQMRVRSGSGTETPAVAVVRLFGHPDHPDGAFLCPSNDDQGELDGFSCSPSAHPMPYDIAIALLTRFEAFSKGDPGLGCVTLQAPPPQAP